MPIRSWLIIAATAALLLFAGGAVHAADNLLKNPGFEGEVLGNGWTIGAHWGVPAATECFVRDEQLVHAGRQSLKLVSDSDTLPVILESELYASAPGERLLFTINLKSDAAVPRRHATIYLLSSDYGQIATREIYVGDTWERHTVAISAVNGSQKTDRFRARIDLRDSGTLWIDEAGLYRYAAGEPFPQTDGVGYRLRSGPGEATVALTLGDATGRTLPDIHGVCFCHGFGADTIDPRFTELGLKVVRNHNVLTQFPLLNKEQDGSLRYDWTAFDASIDAILRTGAVPQMSLCFVPVALVDNPDPAKTSGGAHGTYHGPPSDLGRWSDYITRIVQHCKAKYDISGWYWIFGNEANFAEFSMGTQDDYYNLYRETVAAAVQVDPAIRIGAGSFCDQEWFKNFLDKCGRDNTRIDLLSWHHYGMVPEDFLHSIAQVRRWAAAYPNTRAAALVIDEWNPRLNTPGGSDIAALQAASIRYLMEGGILYHTFFIAQAATPDFCMIDAKGVKMPTFNVFKLLAMMGSQELALSAPDDEPYIGGLAAAQDDGSADVLFWYAKHDSDVHDDVSKEVTLRLGKRHADAVIDIWLIDDAASNGLKDPRRQELEKTTAFSRTGDVVTLMLKPHSVALLEARKAK